MSPDADNPAQRELWHDILHVMLEDIARIQLFIGRLDSSAFAADEKCVFAVCYAYVRLGEAVGKIPDSVKAKHPGVPWLEIRHFRNFMIHVYLDVDPSHLHTTAMKDLPELASQLRSVLRGELDP